MVLSCLVEPLVKPLVGSGRAGGRSGRRSGISRSRLAATALAASAIMAIATNASASEILEKAQSTQKERVVCNAHKKPDPIPYRVFVQEFCVLSQEQRLPPPSEAPDFEWDAILAHRLRHSRDIVRDTGPGLGLAQRLDRLRGAGRSTFLHFQSGQHRSGAPNANQF